jgi:hypothetical protein
VVGASVSAISFPRYYRRTPPGFFQRIQLFFDNLTSDACVRPALRLLMERGNDAGALKSAPFSGNSNFGAQNRVRALAPNSQHAAPQRLTSPAREAAVPKKQKTPSSRRIWTKRAATAPPKPPRPSRGQEPLQTGVGVVDGRGRRHETRARICTTSSSARGAARAKPCRNCPRYRCCGCQRERLLERSSAALAVPE